MSENKRKHDRILMYPIFAEIDCDGQKQNGYIKDISESGVSMWMGKPVKEDHLTITLSPNRFRFLPITLNAQQRWHEEKWFQDESDSSWNNVVVMGCQFDHLTTEQKSKLDQLTEMLNKEYERLHRKSRL